ncbi:MAG: S46 family peptidase [Bacteroidota bacterium]|nr:S46 family peptidase [Bacteroidota bacterium]
MQKRILILVLFIMQSLFLLAGEGMWLPLFLKSLNEAEMKSMGMKMSAEDIYSVNKGSLKDAIVHFGGGCTAEIISGQGLLLTNHHCGYGYIQDHSTVAQNYLVDGFWAKSKTAELACGGLTATMIVRIEDVSIQVLQGVKDGMNDRERKPIIDKNLESVRSLIAKKANEDLFIRSFYNSNQWFAFVTLTYKDIRLVGTPPESIGKFGADTDNWVWPRHTGDFSLFRIYAGKDNLPAEYSAENIPYTPKHFLPISLDGVSEGDFTMVFGFPGRTNEYLTKEGMRQIIDVQNPIRISMRDQALKIMDKYMRADAAIKIKYASIYAGIANSWKKWIGENQGVKFTKALDKKQKGDEEFQRRVSANPAFSIYKNLIVDLENQYRQLEPYTKAKEHYAEAFQRNINLYSHYAAIKSLRGTYDGRGAEQFLIRKTEMVKGLDQMFHEYDKNIEQEIFTALLALALKGIPERLLVPYIRTQITAYQGNQVAFAKDLYVDSYLTDVDKMRTLLSMDYDVMKQKLDLDPVWKFYEEMNYFLIQDINVQAGNFEERIGELRREHMAALMKVMPEKKYYPDANSTLRITYGKVNGFNPRDGVQYQSQTYLDGVLEKYVPGDYEFDVPQKLISLYKEKNYGVYGENGKMPIAFIASNHTTGGNSGSPAIDAHGNLIGLNFDRVWEGTMSDINYDASICRNIMVDARYILFIIDKFAGAGHLVQEMKIVHPKAKSKKRPKMKKAA